MSERAEQLHGIADEQIADLIALVSTLDDTTMRFSCPGREKLGDGTIAAAAKHTADNYQRIARFVETSDRMTGAGEANGHAGYRVPRFLRALGHRPPDHADHGHDAAGPGEHEYAADNVQLPVLREQLVATRAALTAIAALSDGQLQTIPPEGSFRFCDARRTLDQVLDGLLKHQRHQVSALSGAIASPPTGG